MKHTTKNILASLLLLCTASVYAQEIVTPLQANPALFDAKEKVSAAKKTRAILPFVEDFAYSGPYPDQALWVDKQAYINNTMSYLPVNRGVATLDGLNEFGRPYFTSPISSGTADSLTSVSINLSAFTQNDNIFFSFYYQPQGLGFAPEGTDSLFLYFKNNTGQWMRMWETRGTTLQPFRFVIMPVIDAQFLHNDFQFRFVNVASLNTNDDVWNIDYIKMDVNRTNADSIMNDLGFTEEPGSLLANYRSMPYRHFVANQVNELSANQLLELRNQYAITQNFTLNHQAIESISGTPVSSTSLPATNIGAKSVLLQTVPSFPISFVPPNNFSKVVIESKYFINPINVNDRKKNDTIVREAVFDNYFAYDDGSAEKSYFLLPAPNFPSKTALDFTLNQADTLRGLAVHFGAQLPTALGKYFSIVLYKKLKGPSNADTILYQQDLYKVQYEPLINGFTTYGFDNPVALEAGKYYIGITQPANFGSDSIYYGLDVNNNTNTQHLFYNVDGTWLGSGVQGSLMMRPIVGLHFTPTGVQSVNDMQTSITVYPNPTQDVVFINASQRNLQGSVFDNNGSLVRTIKTGEKNFSLAGLQAGLYILVLRDENDHYTSHKIIKQ